MLKRLKRWLGWDSDAGLFDFSDLENRNRSRPGQGETKPKPAPITAKPTAAAQKPKKDRVPMDVLDNPRLTLDRPTDDGFDPYNTGAFNRSASWEKIGRQRKR
jgi:hypothetical protein